MYSYSSYCMAHDKQKAIMLTRKQRANYRTGYWVVIFTHTKSLGVVPEDMRVRLREKGEMSDE